MAILKTYPLKNNYYGPDRLVISDMQPDDQGIVHGTTKSLTLSNLKSFIGGSAATLQLTTNFTSGAATFDANSNTLNILIYIAATNNTYELTAPSAGVIRLTGSDTTTDDVSVSGSGGITVTQNAANNVNIDGSGISGGVAQVTAVSPATSTGTPLVVTPTTGNVTVQSLAYGGATNVGHVPAGGTVGTFLRGDGNFATVVTSTPAFSPNPIYMGRVARAISTLQTYLLQWYSTVKMSPRKIKLFFPVANGEDISIGLYKATLSPLDGGLYASVVNHNIGTTNGTQEITLTQESGQTDIEVGDAIAMVVSIKGNNQGDTLLSTDQGVLDTAIGQVSTTQSYISSSFPANVNGFNTGFGATKVRPAFFLY